MGEDYILRHTFLPILRNRPDVRQLDGSKEVKALFPLRQGAQKKQLSADLRAVRPVTAYPSNRTARSQGLALWAGHSAKMAHSRPTRISGPQPFRHQGPISGRQPVHRQGDAFKMIQAHHIYCGLYSIIIIQFHPPQIIRH